MAQTGDDVSPEDGHRRAIEDYSQFSQYARNAAQFAFAANGGAAAAILSFLTSIVNSTSKGCVDKTILVHSFAMACSFYLIGLLVSIVSLYFFAISKKKWGDAWEEWTRTGKIDFGHVFAKTATRLELYGWKTLALSALVFAGGSIFAVYAFFVGDFGTA